MNLKELAARRALDWVRSGMALGLGSGTTFGYFLTVLAGELQAGTLRDIVGVPTSERTAALARAAGVPLTTLDECPRLDLAVDGADEVAPNLDLVKGLGAAMLREKVVAAHAARFLILVDESKLVPRLGTRAPLPVETVPFGVLPQLRWLAGLGCRAELRCDPDGSPLVTDNGNYLALCRFPEGIPDPQALARVLADRPGIVEHGLFLGMASAVVVAGSGGVRVLERQV
jgi:ribose 5-phosphate isomerase A